MNVNQLTPIIFRVLSIYLIYNNSFKSVLELSLISKSTFKHFQLLIISHKLNKFKFIIPTATQFIKYIIYNNDSNNKNNDEQSYNYKLIQYKDIESIRFSKLNGKENQVTAINYFQYSLSANKHETEITTIVNQLQYLCKELKKVVLLDRVIGYTGISFDFTFGGFIIIKKLKIYWDQSQPPESIEEDIAYEEYLENGDNQDTEFLFSFSFLLKYNPHKLYIYTNYHDELNLDLIGSNILNCKSIKSIEFISHTTSKEFIQSAISSSSNIKSLIIKPYQEMDTIYNSFEQSNFQDNKIISKLLFRYHKDYSIKYNNYNPVRIFEMLKMNKSIKGLGLELFKISDSDILIPLLEIENICKLYVDNTSLESTLKHCNLNKNIKELHYFYDDMYPNTIIISILNDYFSQPYNTTSLQLFKIQGVKFINSENKINWHTLNNAKVNHPNLIIINNQNKTNLPF